LFLHSSLARKNPTFPSTLLKQHFWKSIFLIKSKKKIEEKCRYCITNRVSSSLSVSRRWIIRQGRKEESKEAEINKRRDRTSIHHHTPDHLLLITLRQCPGHPVSRPCGALHQSSNTSR
jgi:alanyl-tRNA synthetase